MTIVLFIMSFANFVFYPLVIGFIIALIVEQVLRRGERREHFYCYDSKKVSMEECMDSKYCMVLGLCNIIIHGKTWSTTNA